MELAIPAVALGGLYLISQQQNNKKNAEGMVGYKDLPNTNTRNVNYPTSRPMENPELTMTEKLTHNNKYSGTAYQDTFFNQNGTIAGTTSLDEYRGSVDAIQSTNDQTYTSLTGQQVQGDYFSHNNMVPFFGSKNTARTVEQNNESVLDNYLGKGSQSIEKKEQAPLFAPNENYQWAYGTPVIVNLCNHV